MTTNSIKHGESVDADSFSQVMNLLRWRMPPPAKKYTISAEARAHFYLPAESEVG